MTTNRPSGLKAYDLRELEQRPYFTQCKQCEWKGTQIGGYDWSVCPKCSSPLFSFPVPHVAIAPIHRAGNEMIRDIMEYSYNPYSSPHKIRKGFEMAAIEDVDPLQGDTVETLQRKLEDARKDAEREIKRRF